MWQHPWHWKESIAFVSGILLTGLLLQLTTGEFDFALLRYPVNALAGGAIILLAAAIALGCKRSALCRWFTGVPMAVTLIAAFVVVGVIMGLTPQVATRPDGPLHLLSRTGIDRMTHAWPFILLYFLTLLSLGSLLVRRLLHFRLSDYAFHLNHAGLWLLLFAAGLGAADMERFLMRVDEGEVEWRATDSQGRVMQLPIAIELHDFSMEEYPPSLTIIHRKTGASQPEEKPEFLPIDPKMPTGRLAGWDIRLLEYIHEAVRNSDSTYREVHMPGASPAARITARNPVTGVERTGWICPGNISQLYMVLNLDSNFCVAATMPEPRRFISDVTIYRKGHDIGTPARLEVNRPFRAGPWTIYQHSYDNAAGKLSEYTVVELVYDPWLMLVYVGIVLLAAGSVSMLWGKPSSQRVVRSSQE